MGAISTGDCGRTRSLAGSVPAVTSNHDHRSARIEGAPKGFPAQIGPKQMTKHGQRSVNDGGSAAERGRKRRDNETERERERERDGGSKRRRRRRRRRLEITVILKRGEIRGWFPWVAAICPLGAAKLQEAWPTGLWSLELAAVQPAPLTPEIERDSYLLTLDDGSQSLRIPYSPRKRIARRDFTSVEVVRLHVSEIFTASPFISLETNDTTIVELKSFIDLSEYLEESSFNFSGNEINSKEQYNKRFKESQNQRFSNQFCQVSI